MRDVSGVRRLVIMLTLPAMFTAVPRPSVAADDDPSLADALTTFQSTEKEWGGCYLLLALAAEFGIPEQSFQKRYPGARWDQLPPRVLEALKKGSDSLPEWIAAAEDRRPTKITEGETRTGTTENVRRLTCGELAKHVISLLLPAAASPKAEQGAAFDFKALGPALT